MSSFCTLFCCVSACKKWLLVLPLLLIHFGLSAQCSNWNININNVQPSTCVANGSFSVALSGADLANLSNIKYSIPLTAGFSVPPNSSPNFISIPPGTFPVKVDADCGATTVSKTTTVTIGGSYTPPTMLATQQRGSLNCGAYGRIGLYLTGSSDPYTVQIVSAPVGYNGPTAFVVPADIYSPTTSVITDLPAGTYTLQMTDGCGSATATQNVTVASLSPTDIPLVASGTATPTGTGCNTVRISKPFFSTNDPAWAAYSSDVSILYEVACSIDGGQTITPYEPLNYQPITIVLPPGQTYKDVYGDYIIFYIKPVCGPVFQRTASFPTIFVSTNTSPNCAAGFIEHITFSPALICYPITITIQGGSTTYGPYTISNGSFDTPQLPYGSYTLNYATADGFNGTTGFSASPPGANPYSVAVMTDNRGLNNYIKGFRFNRSGGNFPPGTTIQLVSGPAGYAYSNTINGNTSLFFAEQNMAPLTSTNRYFVPGTYTWNVTDNCGTYPLTISATADDTYTYTMNTSDRQETCNGLVIKPAGSCVHGSSTPLVHFQVLSGPPGYTPGAIPQGGSLLLSAAGTYTIGVGADFNFVDQYDTQLPNAYQVTEQVIYDPVPLAVDINNTQGFLCVGAVGSQGQVIVKGQGGKPFLSPAPHYKYYLAAQGQGQSGPYIANNTTGMFPAIGAANDIFDVKIVDTCGAFVVQQIKILDLSSAQLITTNGPVLCEGDSLALHALPLPGGSYSWTGPAGFTCHQRDTVLYNVSPANSGQYAVTITSSYCNTSANYSVNITVNPAPGKATITVQCVGDTAILIASPVPGADYQWYRNWNSLAGETNNTYHVTQAGTYAVYTIFPATGCMNVSDSLLFTTAPGKTPTPFVSVSTTVLCAGDEARLIAGATAPPVSYEWYLDGTPIPGANKATLTTSTPGSYTVQISTGPCSFALSQPVDIIRPVPPAGITAYPDTVFCEGDSVIFAANTGIDLNYTWQKDGEAIAGATTHTYTATAAGYYNVIVSNGLCSTPSPAIQVIVHPLPQPLITRYDLTLQTTRPFLTYQWYYEGHPIEGATAQHYQFSQAGYYSVSVTDQNGCEGMSAPFFVASLDEACIVRIPDAFTPNGDGLNDELRLIAKDVFYIHSFHIVNRWGQVVFETLDERRSWNGTFGGTPQEAGTYFYLIRYQCAAGSRVAERKGSLLLIR